MKKEEIYATPAIAIIEVSLEQGFALTTSNNGVQTTSYTNSDWE